MSDLHAVVIAPPPGTRRRKVTGLTLAERARRVAVRAGIAAERVHVVRTGEELAAAGLVDADVLVIRASDQVVAKELVEPLIEAGSKRAVDQAGSYAGAFRADAADASAALAALEKDIAADQPVAASLAAQVEVGPRARHVAITDQDFRAADAWQFQLVHKPMDAFMTRRLWRPLARPFTRTCLLMPFATPNRISITTMIMGVIGCVIAAGESYQAHLIGMSILFVSAIGDNCDGEVARLRLESSNLGAYLDAIGDDVARIATLIGVGLHVAQRYPAYPLTAVTIGATVVTLLTMGLIYYYTYVVASSWNNQDYTKALGIGPGVGTEKSLKATIGSLLMQAIRRDFIDVGVFVFAIVDLPEVPFVGLTLGAVIGLLVVLPNHFKIVRQRATRG